MTAFTALSEARGTVSKAEYDQKLKAAGFSSIPDLEDYLKKLEKSLTRARNRELGIDDSENKVSAPSGLPSCPGRNLNPPPPAHALQEAPSFPLIDVPDHQLNEEDLKEKRRQKLMKAGYDARIRLKAEKDEERRRVEDERRRDEELRQNDFPRWLQGLREQHEVKLFSLLFSPNRSSHDSLTDESYTTCPPTGHHREDQGAQEAQGAARGSKVARGAEPHEVDRRIGGGREGG